MIHGGDVFWFSIFWMLGVPAIACVLLYWALVSRSKGREKSDSNARSAAKVGRLMSGTDGAASTASGKSKR